VFAELKARKPTEVAIHKIKDDQVQDNSTTVLSARVRADEMTRASLGCSHRIEADKSESGTSLYGFGPVLRGFDWISHGRAVLDCLCPQLTQ